MKVLNAILSILFFVAWVTHIFYTFSAGSWILGLIGLIIFPLGVINGILLWLDVGFV